MRRTKTRRRWNKMRRKDADMLNKEYVSQIASPAKR
jgi:hypothetical protein